MPEHLVAIHQPNFFPWLGYFDKIRRADTFVFLDDVQFPKTGGVWTNRVQVLRGGQARWLTAPIDRSYHGLRRVNEVTFAACDWREKILRQLTEAYRAAPFFAETMALLTPLILYPEQNVAAYNIHAITVLCKELGLSARLVTSSALAVTEVATARLIALTRAVGGTQYLCGGGAEGYQEDKLFVAHGLTLTYQQFTSEPYAQQGTAEFIGGLSVLDALMHGQDQVRHWNSE
jgi:hypothetical protein